MKVKEFFRPNWIKLVFLGIFVIISSKGWLLGLHCDPVGCFSGIFEEIVTYFFGYIPYLLASPFPSPFWAPANLAFSFIYSYVLSCALVALCVFIRKKTKKKSK